MGISIMSYAGTVTVGIMTDVCTVPDPITIAENFNAELRDDAKAWLLPAVTPAEEAPINKGEQWDFSPETIAGNGDEAHGAAERGAQQPEGAPEIIQV